MLFLAFIPGNPSIVSKLKEVYDAKTEAKELFYLRGAATSPDPASIFRVDLYHRTPKVDATVRAVSDPPHARADAAVDSVAGIFATFAKWEAEIYEGRVCRHPRQDSGHRSLYRQKRRCHGQPQSRIQGLLQQ